MGLLYTRMKIFHYQEKLASLPVESPAVLPPIHVRVKPTNTCNHNCWYCAYRRENIQLGKDMVIKGQIPEGKMMEIVDDFIDMGVKAVTFSGGGEPLGYPHLLATVNRLVDGGIKVACLTNGALLKGALAEVFAHRGAWIRVSLDGWDGPSYAAYRGVSFKEFDKVMGNLKAFHRMGGPCYLGAVVIVDERNASHVYELIGQLRDLGAHSVKVAPCLVSNDSAENNLYHEPFFTTVREQTERAFQDFMGPGFEIFDSYFPQLSTFTKDYSWCPYLQVNPVIGADLNVYACHDKAYNIEEGRLFSIDRQGFRDGWHADKSQFFRIVPSRLCNHHCMVHEKNRMIIEYLDADPDHLAFV